MRRTAIAILTGFAAAATITAGLASATAAQKPEQRAQAGPTAEQLRDRVTGCAQQVSNGRYAERGGLPRDIPVCATANAVHWRSGMTVDCDGQPTDACNENTDPAFQPETAFSQSDGRPLVASRLPYVVVPTPTDEIWNYRDSGIRGGTVVAIVYQDTVVYGVVGDVGPATHIGEASYATAAAAGIDPDPSSGGVSGKVVDYIAFPGVVASPIEDDGQAVALGEQAAARLVSG
jgi:hypothetical protein